MVLRCAVLTNKSPVPWSCLQQILDEMDPVIGLEIGGRRLSCENLSTLVNCSLASKQSKTHGTQWSCWRLAPLPHALLHGFLTLHTGYNARASCTLRNEKKSRCRRWLQPFLCYFLTPPPGAVLNARSDRGKQHVGVTARQLDRFLMWHVSRLRNVYGKPRHPRIN